jgi:hypothetical protein
MGRCGSRHAKWRLAGVELERGAVSCAALPLRYLGLHPSPGAAATWREAPRWTADRRAARTAFALGHGQQLHATQVRESTGGRGLTTGIYPGTHIGKRTRFITG